MSAVIERPATAATEPIGVKQFAAAAASVLGWALDLFDLFIILYVAPTIGPLFFPSSSPILSLAAVYAAFGVTLVMRPVGSAIFGPFADRRGRRPALLAAFCGVGIVTALLGALPTIAQVGVLSPVLFLLLRLVQGIFVGGVVAATHTIGLETVPQKWRALVSGLTSGGGGSGTGALLASIVFTLTAHAFPGHAFAAWGWRWMFFSGLLSALVGIVIYAITEETPAWRRTAAARATARRPLQTLLRGGYARVLAINSLVVGGGASLYYLTSGYIPTFLTQVDKLPKPVAGHVLIITSIATIVAAFIAGTITRYLGVRRTMLLGGVLSLVAVPMLYHVIAGFKPTQFGAIVGCSVILTSLSPIATAPIVLFLSRRFPTAIRASGTALSWNIGYAIGGFMPTLVTLSAKSTAQLPLRLSIFVAVVMAIFIVTNWVVPDATDAYLEQAA
ncbi:MAG TPA: MFS transporter [Candidatus Acidoferrum sp.]|nr:MFS transporter [Candidatus Acidoferrum sp.]